jgi:hypothetical protein
VPDIELYLETLFSLLDGLRTWLRQQQQEADAAAAAAAAGAAGTGQSSAKGGRGSSSNSSASDGASYLPSEAVHVDALLKEIPKEMMATAAFR